MIKDNNNNVVDDTNTLPWETRTLLFLSNERGRILLYNSIDGRSRKMGGRTVYVRAYVLLAVVYPYYHTCSRRDVPAAASLLRVRFSVLPRADPGGAGHWPTNLSNGVTISPTSASTNERTCYGCWWCYRREENQRQPQQENTIYIITYRLQVVFAHSIWCVVCY